MMRGRESRYILGLAVLALGIVVLSGCAPRQANRAPLAALATMPDKGYCPLRVAFDASESIDPDGDVLTYVWSFGDGSNGSGVDPTHTYENAGSYDVVLRVTDARGLEDAALATIDVLDVPAGTVVLRFAWTWDGGERRLDVAIPWSLYQMYRGRLRTPLLDNYKYADFVDDPLDDPTLEDLADLLRAQVGGDEVAYAEYALAFVQGGIAYLADPPGMEWPLYPVETLVDGEGDCEDTAILYVSLLKALAVSCQLAFVDTDDDASPDHVLALVEVPGLSALQSGAAVFEVDGALYAVAETAAGTMALGVDPWGLEADDLIDLWPF
jgi:hypothetical protein